MPQKPYPRHREDPTLGPRVKDDAGRGGIASGDKGKTGGEARKSKAHDNDGLTHDAGHAQSYLKGAKVAELVVIARTLTASNSCVAAT